MPAHAVSTSAVIQEFQTDAIAGLSTSRVDDIRQRTGWNELATSKPVPLWVKFLTQFQDVVIWVLLAAAVISGLTGDWTDAAAIIAIVLLNAVLAFFQEERAEQALAGLNRLIVPTAKVLRGGHGQTLPARDLVPGDVIQLEAGDRIPADVRLLHAASLTVQEAVLTGESVAVDKSADQILPPETPLAERTNMAYLGTTVAAGTARAVVVATGMQTQLGQIAGVLESYDRKPTPLQRQLESVGRSLAVLCLGIVLIVFLLNLWRGEKLLASLLIAVSLAVAAVPEGLPTVVTIALALGLQRMARRNALIRKLPSVETLGCVTVICTDKTGTLTRNEMTVREMSVEDRQFEVTGTGYEPRGTFRERGTSAEDQSQGTAAAIVPAGLLMALRIGMLCNTSRLEPGTEPDTWQVIGDPMEGALIVAAMKAGIRFDLGMPPILQELPFDSQRKMMSVVVEEPEQCLQQLTKGAPEMVLECCRFEWVAGEVVELQEARRQQILRVAEDMAGRALRVLACAFRDVSESLELEESDLVFSGLLGLMDPPRDEARQAIQRCQEAGIRTVMLTGDHPTTALAIGRELGLIQAGETVMTGSELEQLSVADLSAQVDRVAIFARFTPTHKLRVVQALQDAGHVVAMTGDGVNDAPAVKVADIGIAMGRTGTDVTREAAAMVLLDDNFTSILNAVEEGRAIYDNIQKFLIYLLSCNIGEMLLMLIAGLVGWPAPLLPIQLLWINLVTDGLPALALALEPAEPDLMRRRPRSSRQTMLSWRLGAAVVSQGLLLTTIGLAAFWYGYTQCGSLEQARTLTFNAVVLGELLRALASRSSVWTFWQLGVATNPYVVAAVAISILLQFSVMNLALTRPVFAATSHTATEWLLLAGLALTPVTVLEFYKLIRQAASSNKQPRAIDSADKKLP